MSTFFEIDVDELAQLIESGAEVVDVREASEYVAAHIPGAHFIALSELEDRVSEIPEGPVYLICRSGARSASACAFLAAKGHQVSNVLGGTMAWIESGRPVVTGMDRG